MFSWPLSEASHFSRVLADSTSFSFRATRASSWSSVLFQNWAKVVFIYLGDPMRSIRLDSHAGGVLGCHWG